MGRESSGGGADGKKNASSGLLRVVWFRHMLHRWQSSSPSSATARRSSASDDGDGANPDVSTHRRNDGDDATPTASDNASDRNPLPPAASHDCAAEDRRPLPPVVVLAEEERRRRRRRRAGCPDALQVEVDWPMTPMTPADAPVDVPRGCCPVYVGAERRRFVVPTAYLGMPVFRRLLEKAEEEFEFHYHGGGVTIPCDTEAFKYILVVMDRHRQGLVDDEGNEKHAEEQGASSSSSQAR